MRPDRIAELLQPFLAPTPESPGTAILRSSQLQQISTYIDLLLRWNSRVNLTSIRQPEEIVTRHFGESLFAARHLFPAPEPSPAETAQPKVRALDVGSGAGFPGLPLKIWAPSIHLTLIESSHKKTTFLREVIRALTLTNVDVFTGRAEDFPETAARGGGGDAVTLRAVEHFDSILPTAVRLVNLSGRMVLLIGQNQTGRTLELAPSLKWDPPIRMPGSASRVMTIGRKESR